MWLQKIAAHSLRGKAHSCSSTCEDGAIDARHATATAIDLTSQLARVPDDSLGRLFESYSRIEVGE